RDFFPTGIAGFIGPPLASGWFQMEFTGNFEADLLVLPYSASLDPKTDRLDPNYFFGFPDHNVVAAPGGGMAGVGIPRESGSTCPGEDVHLRLGRWDAAGALAASADLGCVNPGALSALAANASGDVLLLDGNQGWTLHPSGELTSFSFPPANAHFLFALADG